MCQTSILASSRPLQVARKADFFKGDSAGKRRHEYVIVILRDEDEASFISDEPCKAGLTHSVTISSYQCASRPVYNGHGCMKSEEAGLSMKAVLVVEVLIVGWRK